MKRMQIAARVIAAFMLMIAISSALRGAAAAQDASTPVAASSGYVSVDCVFDDGANQSLCTFTLSGAEASAPDAFIIEGGQLCRDLRLTGTSELDGHGDLRQALSSGNSVSLTFARSVTAASGGGVYQLETGASTFPIPGDSLDCSAPAGGTGTSGAGDPVPVSSTISLFDCTVDPLDMAPASSKDCAPAQGVSVEVTVDGAKLDSFVSDANGLITFDAPAGSAVVVAEDSSTITNGYAPYGNGSVSFTAAAGIERTFVHLLATSEGRLQIASGTCPTSGETRTTFRVVEPSILAPSSVSCAQTGSVPFTITGEGLSAGFAVMTDVDGNWRGYLPGGNYTITSANSTTANFVMYNEQIVVVVAIDYVAQPTGTLTVARLICSTYPRSTTKIAVAATDPGNPDKCGLGSGEVSVAEVDGSANPARLSIGADGVASVSLRPGSYIMTDETSGETATFDLSANTTLYAVISGAPVPVDVAGDGTGHGGNESSGNGTAANADGDASGNSDGGGNESADSGNSSDASAADNAGDSTASDSVTTLPDTGVRMPSHETPLPAGGVVAVFALVLVGACLHRRRAFGTPGSPR